MIRNCSGALLALIFWMGNVEAAIVTNTVSFQNGVNGYAGTYDHRIGNGYSEVDGSTVNTNTTTFYVDGGETGGLNSVGYSHTLLRFEDILGGSGIPDGATVISAEVEVHTTGNPPSANSVTNGAYNVYQLSTPFTNTSTYNGDFAGGGEGLPGDISRIVGSFDGMNVLDAPASARVDRAVVDWFQGGSNYGLGIRSDSSTDGWSYHTTSPQVASENHPKLTVTYTTDPNVALNTYTPSADSFPNGNSGGSVGTIVNGSAVAEGFIDGSDGGTSYDQPYLVRFDNLDLNFTEIVKAELVFVTGFSSTSADTPQPWNVHQMLTDWTNSTEYADFDSDSVPELNDAAELISAGMIAPAATTLPSANDTEVVFLDVTSIVEAWKTGDSNFGFYIGAAPGSTNGWQIFSSGAPDVSLKPELRIIGVRTVPEPSSLLIGLGTLSLALFGSIRKLSRS